MINMTRICKLGRSYLYFNTRWHYFCRLQFSFHGYCEIIFVNGGGKPKTLLVRGNVISLIRKILINIEQMIIHRFVNSWARVVHRSHEQGFPRTLMISQYWRIFWEIQRKNALWLCYLFEWSMSHLDWR